jgi:hypothetical protein
LAAVGYARVSTADQDLALQLDALAGAGCAKVFEDRASGARADRPGLCAALDYAREGDVLVTWKLDRLGRSLPHLIETVAALEGRGVGFRSLTEAIDTTTAGGRLVFRLFAALKNPVVMSGTSVRTAPRGCWSVYASRTLSALSCPDLKAVSDLLAEVLVVPVLPETGAEARFQLQHVRRNRLWRKPADDLSVRPARPGGTVAGACAVHRRGNCHAGGAHHFGVCGQAAQRRSGRLLRRVCRSDLRHADRCRCGARPVHRTAQLSAVLASGVGTLRAAQGAAY